MPVMEALFVADALFVVLLLFLPFCCIWIKFHPCYGRNPGIPAFPIIGIFPSILKNKHRLYEWVSQVLNNTSTLTCRVPIGLIDGIATANPANVEHILKNKFEWYPKGNAFHTHFVDLLGNGIFNADGHPWKLQRKVASQEFTTRSLREFVMDIVAHEVQDRLFPLLSTACLERRPLDLQQLFSLFTFDTICQLTFGTDPVCLHGTDSSSSSEETLGELGDAANSFAQAFDVATSVIADRFLTPPLVWKIKKALKMGNEKKLHDAMNIINKFARLIIQKRRMELLHGVEGEERGDLLSRFISLKDSQLLEVEEGDEILEMSDSFLRDVLLSFLLAGRDTVASALVFLMWLLCRHPRVEKAIYHEISTISKEATAKQNQKGFSFEDLKKMNYLHAALSEAMRLYPPVPLDPKYAMEDDILPDGTEVRRGCRVTYVLYAMGRAERLWGKDCMEFRPERWLNDDGHFVGESPYKYPVFQAGPRVCLGKEFAYIQMKLIVASMIQEFEFKFANPEEEHPQCSIGINLKMAKGLPVTVVKRRGDTLDSSFTTIRACLLP